MKSIFKISREKTYLMLNITHFNVLLKHDEKYDAFRSFFSYFDNSNRFH